MKIINKIWGIGLLAFLLVAFASGKSKAQDITGQDFYDNLAPYGTWVSDPQYGDVWVPDVDGDFRPYATEGHWVLTEYGNTWVSDYPWGWATFHYGRWHYDDYYGWEWIPGYEWAPAWVSWRYGGGYYGWAPLMPGISLSLSFGSAYNVPDNYWVCAPAAYINRSNIYNYYVPYTRTVTIIHHTTIINNTYSKGGHRYIAGPGAADIQRYTHQRPQVYNISNANRPGAINVHNNTVNIFRPAVKKAPGAHPARVVDATAYKQQNPGQRIAHSGAGGAANNHTNAAKLATVARGTNDNKIVHINPVNNNRANHPAQSANGPQQPRAQPATQPGNRPQQPATGANPAQPGSHRGRPENRPTIAPPANAQNPAAQQQPTQAQPQPAQPAVHHRQQQNPAAQQPAQAQPQSVQPQSTQPATQHRGQQHRQQQNPAAQQPAPVQQQSAQPAIQQQQRQARPVQQQQPRPQPQPRPAQQQQLQQQRQARPAQQQQMQQQRQAQPAQQQQPRPQQRPQPQPRPASPQNQGPRPDGHKQQ
jgi:hypothetical protein